MSYALELRNPYFYKKKIPIALLHFSAGFLLLITWDVSDVHEVMPFVGTILFIIGFFELIYTFFSFRMMHRYPKLNSAVRIVTSAAFLFFASLLFREGDISFAIFLLVIGLLFLLIHFIEKKWARPFVLQINNKGILFPGTFKSPLIPWKNFNNVILKDGILTLDLSTNKIMQLEMRVLKDKERVNEINQFCSEKILESQ